MGEELQCAQQKQRHAPAQSKKRLWKQDLLDQPKLLCCLHLAAAVHLYGQEVQLSEQEICSISDVQPRPYIHIQQL